MCDSNISEVDQSTSDKRANLDHVMWASLPVFVRSFAQALNLHLDVHFLVGGRH